MQENPYQPPKSELTLTDNELRKGSPIKAVLIALAVDILAGFVLGIIASFVYTKFAHKDTMSTYVLISYFLGSLISILAGYLCAKIVNYSEFKVVSVFVVITVTFWFLMDLAFSSIGKNILFSFLHLCCIYLGAWIYLRKKHRKVF